MFADIYCVEKPHVCTEWDEDEHFTGKEWGLFNRRLDERFDVPPAGRFALWLKLYHPHRLETGINSCCHLLCCTYMYDCAIIVVEHRASGLPLALCTRTLLSSAI